MQVSLIDVLIRLRDEMSPQLTAAAARVGKFGEQASKAASDLLPIGAALALVAGGAIKMSSDFNKAMTEATAILPPLGNQLKVLEDLARSTALTTTATAVEAANAYYFLASAGITTAQQLSTAMPIVADMAQAGVLPMAKATEYLTDSIKALGLSVETDMPMVADTIVRAAVASNSSVDQLAEALTSKAATAMSNFGISVYEGVAALSVFADRGVKGAVAGERFDILIRTLTDAYKSNTAAFESMNIAVYDGEDNLNNLADIIGNVETALDGMSAKQKVAALAALGFTAESRAAVLTLVGGSKAMRAYENDTERVGASHKIAQAQMLSFENQAKLLQKTVIDVGISLGDVLTKDIAKIIPLLVSGVEKTRALAEGFGKLPAPVRATAEAAGLLVIALPAILFGLGAIGAAAPAVAAGFVAVSGATLSVGAALTASVSIGALAAAAMAKIEVAVLALETALTTGASSTLAFMAPFAAMGAVLAAGGLVIAKVKKEADGLNAQLDQNEKDEKDRAALDAARVKYLADQKKAAADKELAAAEAAQAAREVLSQKQAKMNETILSDIEKIKASNMSQHEQAIAAANAEAANAEASNKLRSKTLSANIELRRQAALAAADQAESMRVGKLLGGSTEELAAQIQDLGLAWKYANADGKVTQSELNALTGLYDAVAEKVEGAVPVVDAFRQAVEAGRPESSFIRGLKLDIERMNLEPLDSYHSMLRDIDMAERDGIAELEMKGKAHQVTTAEVVEGTAALHAYANASRGSTAVALEAVRVENDRALALKDAAAGAASAASEIYRLGHNGKENIGLVVAAMTAERDARIAAMVAKKQEAEIAKQSTAGMQSEIDSYRKLTDAQIKAAEAQAELNRQIKAFDDIAGFAALASQALAMIGGKVAKVGIEIADGMSAGAKGAADYKAALTTLGKAQAAMAVAQTAYNGGLLKGVSAGATFGAQFGPMGAAIGAAAGGLLSLFGGHKRAAEAAKAQAAEEAKLKAELEKTRAEYIKNAGGLDALALRAKAAGWDLKAIFDAKTVKEYEAAVEQLNQVLGMYDEGWKTLQDAMDKYKVTLDQLKPEFAQKFQNDTVMELIKNYNILNAAMRDHDDVLKVMAGDINTYIQNALATGAAVPEAMRPILQEMIRLGLLVDADGNKITDLSKINFTATLEEGINKLIAKITELVNAMLGIPNIQRTVTVTTQKGGGGEDPSDPGKGGTPNAIGYAGWVNRPTTMLVGEKGPEYFQVTPAGKSPASGPSVDPTAAPAPAPAPAPQGPITVNVMVDGGVVATAVAKQMDRNTRGGVAIKTAMQGRVSS